MAVKKRIIFALVLLLTALSLSGCLFTSSSRELYQLPQLPAEYTDLQKQLDEIQNGGAEYAAPVSGANIQPVQLVDLNSDGNQEAVAFFRQSSDDRPLKIYIFHSLNGVYHQAALIEDVGASFYSIQYTDMNQDGISELLVGWRISPELQALSVYSLPDFVPTHLLTTNYVRFAAADLDSDGYQELAVLRSDGSDQNLADYYHWQEDDSLQLCSSARLSMTMAELQDITIGSLTGGEPALFVTGVADEVRAIIDVLACREDRLVNLTVSPSTGVSTEVFRYLGLEPTDIDEDGVTEVPMPALFPAQGEQPQFKVYWRHYDNQGRAEEVCLTYHNTDEDWFLLLPEKWDNCITVRRSGGGTDRVTTFSYLHQDSPVDFLQIYTLTGSDRESRATRGGRFVLKRQSGNVVYAAAFTEAAEWRHSIDEEELRSRFRIIPAEWSAGNQ